MTIQTDTGIDYVNKRVFHAANTEVFDVNVFYSHLQDVFDELIQLDDDVPISAQTPTSYTMINGWYLEEEFTRFLSGAAIQTNGYLNEIHTVTMDGAYTNFVPGDIGLQLRDDAVDVGEILDYDNAAQKVWVRTGSATVIGDNSAITVNGGTGVGTAAGDSTTGEHEFNNPYTLGTLETSNGAPQLYIYQDGNKLVNSGWFGTGQFDILVKVVESGVVIDGRNITVFNRNWNDTGTHFSLALTTAGQNAVPLGNADDLNNNDTEANIEDYTDGTLANIAISFQFSTPFSYDIGDGNGAQDYEVQIDCDNQPLSIVYEVQKWWVRENSTTQLEFNSDGNFINGEAYLAADTSTPYAEVVASALGTFAGGKAFGARSVYYVNLVGADAQNFQLVDAAGVTRTPPNFQAFSVAGTLNLDNVAVFEDTTQDAGVVNKAKYTLDVSNPLNTISLDQTLPTSTPTTGTIVVVDTDGTETVYAYTGFTGSDVTVTVGAGVHDGTETAYIPFIYEQSSGGTVSEVSTIYTSDIPVVAIVRQKGYQPFKITGTYGSSGYQATAQRIVDPIFTP